MNIQKDLSQFNKLSKEKKALIIALIALLFIASVIVGAFLSSSKQKQELSTSTEPEAAVTQKQEEQTTKEGQIPTIIQKPKTNLSILPAKGTFTVGKPEKITVNLSSLPVTAADIYISYDSKVLSVSNLVNGDVFDKQTTAKGEQTINTKEGIIAYHGSLSPTENAQENAKEGVVFTFTVTPLKETESTALTFITPKTKTALAGNNTLGATIGGVYKIEGK